LHTGSDGGVTRENRLLPDRSNPVTR
jgi:hypothetical protein